MSKLIKVLSLLAITGCFTTVAIANSKGGDGSYENCMSICTVGYSGSFEACHDLCKGDGVSDRLEGLSSGDSNSSGSSYPSGSGDSAASSSSSSYSASSGSGYRPNAYGVYPNGVYDCGPGNPNSGE